MTATSIRLHPTRTLLHAGPLRILLTEDPEYVSAAQRLRFEVFAAEPGFSARIGDPIACRDADEFDAFCEHVVAIHDELGMIGCVRLLNPARAIAAGGRYAATEFDLSELDAIGPETVEMGRACVRAGHRDGSVTALLWAAVLRYLEEYDHRHLMGCVSVPLGDRPSGDKPSGDQPSGGLETNGMPRGTALRGARDVLRDRHRAPWQAVPHRQAIIDGRTLDEIAPPQTPLLPPLMRAYLRLGALVCGEPAIDHDFGVGDFLAILDRRTANDRYLARLRSSIERLGGTADSGVVSA